MQQLVVLNGPDAGRRFALEKAVVTVGRHSDSDVPLRDEKVSRRHLELRKSPHGYRLVDLGSGNGTKLNGKTVSSSELRAGNQITVGNTLLEFVAAPAVPVTVEQTRVVVNRSEDSPSAILSILPEDEGGRILQQPDAITSDWLRTRLTHLAVIYEATATVSEILDVDDLLGRVVELVVRTTGADHGCAIEIDASTGDILPKTARSRAGLGPSEFVLSRTVIDHVLTNRQGILVADATADERFRGEESVSRHRLREIICVPMKGRHITAGVLFLDTIGSQGASIFTEDHLKLAAAVAHQAGLAVEETRYYQAMLQSERLAAIGQTIAALSHHIKNIMQGVRFGTSMVKSALAGQDRELLEKGWKLVEKNQRKIDDLILDMLSYSKDREPVIESTPLNNIVTEVLEIVRGRATEAGLALLWEPHLNLPPVACDADGIQRALLNVVSNAVDAIEGKPDGQIIVRTSQSSDGAFAEITVSDNGDGISPDKIPDIFKPFVSTKGAKGTGLGLPVSRKILQEHGGEVLVSSQVGQGSVFVIRLPFEQKG